MKNNGLIHLTLSFDAASTLLKRVGCQMSAIPSEPPNGTQDTPRAFAAAYREQAEMIKALRVFSDFVLAEFWLGVPDAGACQDKAVELGLLEGVEVMEPCGTWCECDDFPQTCYRFTDILTGKPLAAQKAMEGEGNGK